MFQKRTRRGLFLKTICGAAALIASGAGAPYAAASGKTLVYCSEGSPAGFDPGLYTSGVEFTAGAAAVYNRLVDFKPGTTQIEPSLAERWEISQDGREYTFYLRRGVKFHTTPWFQPTREFSAEDVLFTFNRMRDPNMPFRRADTTEFPYWHGTGLARLVEKIEALGADRMAVRFTLKEANAPFLHNLAVPFASIHSAEYAAQLLEKGKAPEINQKPVGTGPFIFRSHTKDTMIRFDGNPHYWKPADVQLSRLIFSITPDAAVRLQKMKRNECQVSVYPRPSDLAAFKADANLKLRSQPSFSMGYLAYNVSRKPLNDVRVRRALDMAINKKAIIGAVYEGHAQIAVAPMPPLQWSYDESLQDAPRDLKKAKALLEEAGYPKGFTISLWAMPIQRPYNPNARLMAEMIQADWAKIGVKANIVTYEYAEYLKRARQGEHDTGLFGWNGDNGDPDNWLSPLLSCEAMHTANQAKWCNKHFEELIQKAARTSEEHERTRLYIEAQKIFKDEQPFTPIAYPVAFQPVRKNVSHFKINPFDVTVFSGVTLK
ncbi:ABC transporter substrate-binding protein [Candidatus Glomeribacter gigasporarum]|uniref:ABC transporter substrate-binding protein n=1 Tax=Candidatus Glomeribacter gigasporarum TaxID=132144 RepID=UPI003B968DEA